MVLTKSEDVAKQGFCKMLRRKLRLREGLLVSLIGVFVGGSGVGWALIRGWALIGINTVISFMLIMIDITKCRIALILNLTLAIPSSWSKKWENS